MDDPSFIIEEYFKKLETLLGTFDFTRQGHEESMGKDAAGIVAQGIINRSVNNQGGASAAWPQNDPERYTPMKIRLYNVALIGFRTGQMISLPSLLGKVDVEPQEVTIRYGTGLPPKSSMSSNYISPSDEAITDTKKAEYFTEKKGKFFELDEVIAGEVHDYFEKELALFIGELNSRH